MADHGTPYFQNDMGLAIIFSGSKRFMCVGAKPPFDHPHVYLDMGSDVETICPYCSTLYRYKPALGAGRAEPPESLWHAA